MARRERAAAPWRWVLTASVVVLSACSPTDSARPVGAEQPTVGSVDDDSGDVDRSLPVVPDVRQAPVDVSPRVEPPRTSDEVGELVVELEAGGFCDPRDVNDQGVVTAMHFVVDGVLQDPCYVERAGGDDGDRGGDVVFDGDPRLLVAWDLLTTLAPVDLMTDISLFAGYEPCSSCDTLAFVSALDEQASFFVVAVDVVAAEKDPDELRLTMMHELTHVFAQVPGRQLDVSTGSDRCMTYYNGVGCFRADSYIWAWIQQFWPPELLATLPADGSVVDDGAAVARCRADPAYTGSYAAIHPEEDFAETFSAYVFDVAVDPALDDKLAFFDRYPEFVAIRANARAAGFSGTESDFDGCGR